MKTQSTPTRSHCREKQSLPGFPFSTELDVSGTTLDLSTSLHRLQNNGLTMKGCIKVRSIEESLATHTLSCCRDIKQTKPQFSTVEIREYPRLLGDNPSTSAGPPISLQWIYAQAGLVSVDSYELCRPPRRSKGNMIVPKYVREEWLLNEGYSRRELSEASSAAMKIRKERVASSHDKMAESKEILVRKFRKWILQKPSNSSILYEKWLEQEERIQVTVVPRVA